MKVILRVVGCSRREPAIRIRDDASDSSNSYVHWSRTGQIVYRSKNGLAVTDETGTSARVISTQPLLAWDWSPEGSMIYAIREAPGRRIELIAIDPNSAQVRQLMDLGSEPVSPEPVGYYDTIRSLAISPDGRHAAFAYRAARRCEFAGRYSLLKGVRRRSSTHF